MNCLAYKQDKPVEQLALKTVNICLNARLRGIWWKKVIIWT